MADPSLLVQRGIPAVAGCDAALPSVGFDEVEDGPGG